MDDSKKTLTIVVSAALTLTLVLSLLGVGVQAFQWQTDWINPRSGGAFHSGWNEWRGYGGGIITPPTGRPTPYGYGMGGHGMMGHGMMGGWYGPTWRMGAGMGCPMMGGYPYYPYYWKPSLGPVTIEEAVNIAERYLASLGIQDLAIEEIQEYTWNFYVLYYEKNTGIGAFEMLIDKYSGAIYPEPGPNMMWNTKYGMMGSYWVQPLEMPITSDQALKIAQSYLDAYLPGAVADHVHTFYGYYTIMVSVGGEPYGMLSVNGYNGQVWYHTWHGSFIQELEFK